MNLTIDTLATFAHVFKGVLTFVFFLLLLALAFAFLCQSTKPRK